MKRCASPLAREHVESFRPSAVDLTAGLLRCSRISAKEPPVEPERPISGSSKAISSIRSDSWGHREDESLELAVERFHCLIDLDSDF
jgi:hypothetical protein